MWGSSWNRYGGSLSTYGSFTAFIIRKKVALITDARFSGVSTGACVSHVGPEALAGGPIGKIINEDIIEIIVDRNNLSGQLILLGMEKKYLIQHGALMRY